MQEMQAETLPHGKPNTEMIWVTNLALLWEHRRTLTRVAIGALLLSTAIAFLIPKQYESVTRIMPPDQPMGSAAMLAALAGRSAPSGLGSLASGLLGVRNTGALFEDLLHSGTVTGHLIDRFNLMKVYGKRYRVDAAKKLARRTDVSDDKKSGVITIVVTDTDRQRARDMAQGYLDELNSIVARVNTSSARREREFIEQRLVTVQQELDRAQIALSDFSTRNTAIDIKEQTRAMVDAGAKVEAGMIVEQTELDSLEQIYGDDNVRVRAARARVGDLQRELQKMGGTENPGATVPPPEKNTQGDLYIPLRQLPRLGVQWANLYRNVRIQETVYELLSAQYEAARIEEAKEIPSVSVIDPPGWPEKKSFPPRLVFMLAGTFAVVAAASLLLLLQRSWRAISETDPRKVLVSNITNNAKNKFNQLRRTTA